MSLIPGGHHNTATGRRNNKGLDNMTCGVALEVQSWNHHSANTQKLGWDDLVWFIDTTVVGLSRRTHYR
jgi:hypothetical protein